MLAPVGLSFVAVLLATSDADAFCRSTTVSPPADYDATSQGCWAQGKPLYDPAQCVPYRLLTKDSPVIPNAILSEKLARAFSRWTASNPTCTPGIGGIELAPVSAARIVGYTIGQPARNIVGVVPEWTHGDELFALTTLTFKSDSGEIEDVDLELNGTARWSFDDATAPDDDKVDLQSVLVHEVGHVLGIAHSDASEAQMNPIFQLGELAPKALAADDERAICTVYPNRAQRLAATGLVPSTPCNLAPGGPDGSCGDPQISHGCSSIPIGGDGTTSAGLVLALGAIAIHRRRTR
jgi:hypothetical protein